MAESLKRALWTQMCLLYVKGTWFGQPVGDTAWAAAKNGEKSTRGFGGPEPRPFPVSVFPLLLMN